MTGATAKRDLIATFTIAGTSTRGLLTIASTIRPSAASANVRLRDLIDVLRNCIGITGSFA
jgi:hypothetical protein